MKHNFSSDPGQVAPSRCSVCGINLKEMDKHLTDEQKEELGKVLNAEYKWIEKFNNLLTEFYPCLTDEEFTVKDIIE